MWWCIFATPALRLAPPMMQLRQADALSAGTGLAAGRAAPMMAVEQQGHSAAFQCHACCPGCLGCLGCAFARRHLRYRQCVDKGACHCLWPPRSNR